MYSWAMPRCAVHAAIGMLRHERRTHDVAPHQYGPLGVPVDEAAREQSDEYAGDYRQRAEHRDLNGICGNEQNRDHR